jgi:hypothetical protein
MAASSLGYWGYKRVTKSNSLEPMLIKEELLESVLPIAFFIGVTVKLWSFLTKPVPSISKPLNVLSNIALSPIWLVETILNKMTNTLSKKFDRTPIPLNIVG